MIFATALAGILMNADNQPKEFESETEAAVRGLQFVAHISETYEWGGVILQKPDGKYTVGLPSTDYRGDAVVIDQDPASYEGTIVATFHTHPCLPVSHEPSWFSPQDLSLARTANHTAYMGDLCTGDVHVWHPGDKYDPPEDKNQLLAGPMSHGRIVGKIAVTKPQVLESTNPGAL